MRVLVAPALLAALLLAIGCSRQEAREEEPVRAAAQPTDAQHQGITAPHGDHRPMHGGMVLMSGDLHYEVLFDRGGRHRVWFTDEVRMDLPASVVADLKMAVVRPGAAPEHLRLEIDEAGESWVAEGRPVEGEGTMVTLTYTAQGEPFEIELPFLIASQTQ